MAHRTRPTFLLLSAALVVATAIAAAQSSSAISAGQALRPLSSSGFDAHNLDRRADACTDFYQFACGGWQSANPIPPDRQRWGQFTEVQDRNFEILRKALESAAPSGDVDRRKAADFYAACMDERTIEARGQSPLEPELARIAAIRRKSDLPTAVAHLQSIGVNVFFRFGSQIDQHDATRQIAGADQGGLGMPDRDYYLKDDARTADIRRRYTDHVDKMLGMLKTPVARGGDALAALAIETKLASAALDRTARRDPAATDHMMSKAEWQALTPSFDWSAYLKAVNAPAFDRLNVAVPTYFRALNDLLTTTSVGDIKVYLTWQLVNAAAEMLPMRFAEDDFDFFSKVLGGQEQQLPRWQRCVTETDARLGEALGKAFVEAAFGPAAKADTLKMVQAIEAAMHQDIEAAAWMTPETKQQAEAKLKAVVDRIGYPDKWRDYSSVAVTRNDALGNLERAIAFERQRALRKIGQPVDRTEWTMTPPTVNAYYSSQRNNINFPAGILQPPFYEEGRDAALNYGGIGAVVGHELTHGFDDQGRKYDGSGNLHDWWTDADAKAYEQRASCLADQYSQYTVAGDTHLNGRLTLGENTADNGGVRLALMAYLAGPGATAQPVDGFTPEQRFFLGYAQIWCENRRPEFDRLRATTDEHSPGRYRVIGVVSNMPEFQKAFGCAPNAPMVRQTQCRVW